MPLTAAVLGCEEVKPAKTLHTSGPVWGSAVPVCHKPPITGETETHRDKTTYMQLPEVSAHVSCQVNYACHW